MNNQGQILLAMQASLTRFRFAAIFLVGLSLISFTIAMGLGSFSIPYESVLAIIFKQDVGASIPESWHVVVWDIRFSRILLSWFVGAGLAISGVIFQGILRNPLADPFTLGVSSGGAFGAAMAISLGFGAGSMGIFALPFSALTGSLLALFSVLALGRIGGRIRRETLVLAGIVVATFLSACISLFKALNEESVAAIVFWIMGSFQGRGWEHLAIFLPLFSVGLLVTIVYARELDLLSLGESQATLLGVRSDRARLMLLFGASCITAGAVSVCGIVGFIGLVVPHLIRLIQGGEHPPLLMNSALLGGLLLLWSDTLARIILPQGAELPVGVITAMLGGPFFCFLLRSRSTGLK